MSSGPKQYVERTIDADVVIVGGGMAGLELAHHLDVEGGPSVIVLEAGPADDLSHLNLALSPEEAVARWLDPVTDPTFWRPWQLASAPHYGGVAGLRRRLGGRSLYWHGVILPIEAWALEGSWPPVIVSDLTRSFQERPSLYSQVQSELADWSSRPSAHHKAPLPRQIKIGSFVFTLAPRALRRVDGERWEAYSPVAHFRNRLADESGRVQIRSNHEVEQLLLRSRLITGVVARRPTGERETVRAPVVVLAAGTIESTRLVLDVLGNPSISDDPITHTHGLNDHISQGFVSAFSPDDIPDEIRELAVHGNLFYAPVSSARSNLFLELGVDPSGSVVVEAWAMGEQIPGQQSSIESVRSETGASHVIVRTAESKDDLALVDAQRALLKALWSSLCTEIHAVPRPLDISTARLLSFQDSGRTRHELVSGGPPRLWKSDLGSENHESGTLAIGTMVDEDLQFYSIPNLYAVGPSVFPRSGAANPSLTTLALSRRLAAHLHPSAP